jgi:hypothetical protein
MDLGIITRHELEENIARVNQAETVGMPEDRFNQFKLLVDHDVQLLERLKNRTWITTQAAIPDRLEERETGKRHYTVVMLPARLFIDLNLAVYKVLFESSRRG